MSRGQLTSQPHHQVSIMDVHLRTDPRLLHGVNGAAGGNTPSAEEMQFLSQEEQECIQFFEETIDSLEESIGDEQREAVLRTAASSANAEKVDRSLVMPSAPTRCSSPGLGPNPDPLMPPPERAPIPKDHDIIDLVQPEQDLVRTREPFFNPNMPDFQTMVVCPESHFEVKPRHEGDLLASEYNPPLSSSSYGSSDGHSTYYPAGSIPTPVLIAQKIAENQGSGTSNLQLSSLLRHKSFESDKPTSPTLDPVRQGPPTSAKPSRFPSNINVMRGSKEHQNQSNVNIEERRALMLAHLMGTSHDLGSSQKACNVPTRSVSFRDPTPDKSRMEALSKLGLTRNRAMSGGISVYITPNRATPPPPDPPPDTATSARPAVADVPSSPAQTENNADRKPESGPTDSVSSDAEKTSPVNPSPVNPSPVKPSPVKPSPVKPSPVKPSTLVVIPRSSYQIPQIKTSPPVSPPPEVTPPDFNSYGGKTVVINPWASPKGDSLASVGGHDSRTLPSALSSPCDFNSYGGKSKVMSPAVEPLVRSELPDILSSHIDKSRSLPPQHHFGGKTRTITPAATSSPPPPPPSSSSVRSPGARTPKALAPSPSPKPSRHQSLPAPVRRTASPVPSEPRRKSGTAFRPQGITVQFSGKGATDEERRDALRKLGILKD